MAAEAGAVTELRFRAMGSDAHVVVVGGPGGLAEIARDRIEALEALWSRFRPDSEVSELTQQAGRAVAVSHETVILVERAVDAWRLTGGSFDPTVLGSVLRAGYVRPFDELGSSVAAGSSPLIIGCTDIVVDGGFVTLPSGTGFDPGGIGKGLAADLVTLELLDAGAAGACVNLGGDLRVGGESPDATGWTVGVEHPWSCVPLALVGLASGAVATSTTLRRTWTVEGRAYHHLIDPATGEPSDTDLTLAAVVAGDAWRAEVLAKAVLLRGARRALDLIDPSSAQVLFVDRSGCVQWTDGLTAYLGGVRPAAHLDPPEPRRDER